MSRRRGNKKTTPRMAWIELPPTLAPGVTAQANVRNACRPFDSVPRAEENYVPLSITGFLVFARGHERP